jgi:hypothetical protein
MNLTNLKQKLNLMKYIMDKSMKNMSQIFIGGFVLTSALTLTGCTNYKSVHSNDKQISEVSPGVYVMPIYLDGTLVYFFTDKDGNVLKNGYSITAKESSGKSTKSVSTMNGSSISSENNEITKYSKYNIKCDNLSDCEDKIKIMEESINLH